MAAQLTCNMCFKTAQETEEKQLKTCGAPNCLHANRTFCISCGIGSHNNHRVFDHEFGGTLRSNTDIQKKYKNAIIENETTTSITNHGTKKLVGNGAMTLYAIIAAGKAALKESGKKYTTKQLFEAGSKALCKNGSKAAKGLAKGAVGLQAIICIYECGVEISRYNQGIISKKELGRLICKSVSANTMTLAGAAGGASAGAFIAGPPGALIGGIIGGIAADAATRYAFDRFIWSNEKLKKKNADIKEALQFWQYMGNIDDIWTDDGFNEQWLETQYHGLAMKHHPDRKGGSDAKFAKVLKMYNLLLGLLKEKEKRNN